MTREEALKILRGTHDKALFSVRNALETLIPELRAWCEKKGITPFELYPKQPEQPVEGLEEEIDRFENWMETYNQADYPTSYTTRDIARHFAEWQKVQDQKTIELAEDHAMLAGMNKMEQQMMEKAVECMVMDFSSNLPRPQVDIRLDPGKYHTGDKVKVIVIKEE